MSTRIVDLPINENITMGNVPNFGQQQNPFEPIKTRAEPKSIPSISYQPMLDVHPNPFIPKPNAIPDFAHKEGFTLPSRDMPRETLPFMQDEQIQADYIPREAPRSSHNDYIDHHEKLNREKWEEMRKHKNRQSKIEYFMTEFQTPFCLAILFFIFQLPTFNSLIFKHFAFLSIYQADGNFNFYGFAFKSLMFGFCYYLCISLMDYLIE